MSSILVNDVFEELREENRRLYKELYFESNLNRVLEKIKTNAFVLKTNCICDENMEQFRQLNDLEIEYKLLKAKQRDHRRGRTDDQLYDKLTLELNTGTHPTNGHKSNHIDIHEETVTADDTFDKDMDSFAQQSVQTFKCNECQTDFKSNPDLRKHENDVHNKGEDRQPMTSKSVSKPKTITDYLRSYRRQTNGLLSDESVDDNDGSNKRQKTNQEKDDFNFISNVLMKKKATSRKTTANGNTYACPLCPKKFPGKSAYEKHNRSFHPEYKPFKCNINGCTLGYYRCNHLQDHIKAKHSNKTAKTNREVSKELALNESNNNDTRSEGSAIESPVKLEVKMEADVKPDISNIKIEVIDDSDDELELRKDSDESDQTRCDTRSQTTSPSKTTANESMFCCHSCGYRTLDRRSFEIHLKSHSNQNPLTCDNCGKVFTRKDSLSKHKRMNVCLKHQGSNSKPQASKSKTKDTKTGEYQCTSCAFKTREKSRLERHSATHSNERPFKCLVKNCKFAAKWKDVLNKHLRAKHEICINSQPKFVCDFPNCNLRFGNETRLRQHKSVHKNKFSCRWTGCEFRTDTFAKLNEHKRQAKHIKPEHM